MLAANGQAFSCPLLHPRILARPGEPKWAALLRKLREDSSFVPRIVLIDSFANLRLGGGNRWTKRGGSSMYAPSGNHTFVAAAQTVAATLSRNINTSRPIAATEPMGWAAEGIDWALVQTRTHDSIARGLCELSQRYDVLMAFTSALQWPHNGDFRACAHPKAKAAQWRFAEHYCALPKYSDRWISSASRLSLNGSNIVMLIDEPPPIRRFDETRSFIGRMGLCSHCVFSHFHLPRETWAGEHIYTPAPYNPQLYAPYRVRATERRRLFFIQKRSQHRVEVTGAMFTAGYGTGIQEASHHSQVQPYASYLRGFAACRWAIALDFSKSAGQVIAEAALLGVPIFSYANKANARLLLPPELLVSSGLSPNATADAIARVVQTYEDERAYAALSAGLIRRAEEALRLRNSRERAAMLLQCCQSERSRS